jgi:hypothetical protein
VGIVLAALGTASVIVAFAMIFPAHPDLETGDISRCSGIF